MQNLISDIKKSGKCAVYIDENGDFEFAASEAKEYVVQAKHDLFTSSVSLAKCLDALKVYFSNKAYKKVFFDAKQALHVLASYGVVEINNYEDISIIKHLVSGMSVKSVLDLGLVDAEKVPVAVELLKNLKKLDELESLGMMKLYREVELPLVEVLYSMEKAGFKVDTVRLEEISEELNTEIAEIKKDIYDMAGLEFNLNSPKQLADVL